MMKIGDKIKIDYVGIATCIHEDPCIFISENDRLFKADNNTVCTLMIEDDIFDYASYKEPTRIPYTMETFEKDRDCWFINGARYKATSYGKNEVYLVSFGLITYKRLYEIFTHEDGSPAGYLEE